MLVPPPPQLPQSVSNGPPLPLMQPSILLGTAPVQMAAKALCDKAKPPSDASEAAKDFAAILFGYMFSEMRPKADEEEGLLGGQDTEMFMDFFDQAVGRHFVEGGGSALADSLLEALVPKDAQGRAQRH